ncbi:MAG: exodeoxyribonuclease VII small subunit [Halioglobus sp.]
MRTLEDEQSSLEDSFNAFELGIKLIRQAQQTLIEAEQKVKLLLEDNGEPKVAPITDGNIERANVWPTFFWPAKTR